MSEVIEKLKEYYHLEDRDGRLFIWKEGMDKPSLYRKATGRCVLRLVVNFLKMNSRLK